MDNTSPGLSTTSTRRSGTSPMRRQHSNQQSSQPFADPSANNSPYFSITPAPSNQGMLKATQQHSMDPISASFMPSRAFEPNGVLRSSRHNSDEDDRYAARSQALGNNDAGVAILPQRQQSESSTSGFNSGVASRNGSLPPSRNGVDPSLLTFGEDMQSPTYIHTSGSSITGENPRFKLSAQANAFARNPNPSNQRFHDLPNSAIINDMTGNFAKMGLANENHPPQSGYGVPTEPGYPGQGLASYDYPQQAGASNANASWDADEQEYPELPHRYTQNNMLPFPPQGSYRSSALNPSYPHSPASSDGRRNSQSPYYSSDAASSYALQHRPPLQDNLNSNLPPAQAQLLDRKLRGIQQEQHGYLLPQMNPMHFRPPFPNPYDFHPSQAVRLNHLNQYYPAPAMSSILPVIPRGPAKDQDSSHTTRSACLEEFRSNSKTNKRYEFKVRADHEMSKGEGVGPH